jgi:Ca-activated chloride channel family protein
MARGLLVSVLVGAAVAAAGAQDPQQPVFRGGTRTVPVYATVNDGAGGFVLDLTRDDFEVRDNGKAQRITQFTTDLQPVTALLLLDGSGSMLPSFDAVLEGANSFIIRMLPADRARIGSFADIVRLGPDFTSNRDTLLDYLKDQFNLRMANETRLWDALHTGVLVLGQATGRRVVLVFTDGYDTVSTSTPGAILSEAASRDVMVYAIAMWVGRGSARQRPNVDLETLATETGGGFYELSETDEMNSTFTRIATEVHLQYVLGFVPEALDGKVHKLEVRVRQPGMKVRARKSYVAEAGK